MSDDILPFQIHTICRCDFDFSSKSNSIYTVGEDSLLKKFHVQSGSAVSVVDLQDPTLTIATFPDDESKVVIGNDAGYVDIITDLNIKEPSTIMEMKAPIYRLVVSQDGQYVGAVYDSFSIGVYSMSEKKLYRPKPAHESSCLHIGFDSQVKYVCSSGCEGFINIYSLESMRDNPLNSKIKSQRIGKETKFGGAQLLRFDWHPTETLLALPGDFSLQILREKEDQSWAYSVKHGIRHDAEISAVCWNSDGNRLVTFSVDKMFKMWSFNDEDLLLYFECVDGPIYSLKFSPKEQVYGFVTHSGYFGVWRDYGSKAKTAIEAEKPKEQAKDSKKKKREIEFEEDKVNQLDRILEEDKPQDTILSKKPEENDEIPYTLDENSMKIAKEEKGADKDAPVREKKLERLDDEGYRSYENKKRVQRHADIIDTSAQPILYSSSTNLTKNKRFLCWNLVGSIVHSEEGQFTAIDVDFANKGFHSNIRILDQYKISMGTMNEKGIVLASRAVEVREDEYENELIEEKRKLSHIMFRPLNALTEKEREWVISLPEDENVDTVSIGNNWIAAITDVHFIRFFNFKGLQTRVLCLEKPIVCSAGYENLLAIVYHDSPPFLGCQSLKVRVIDTETMESIYDSSCPISPNSTMTWFGFSDGGMLISQDSRGVMRGLPGYKQWWPLYFADETKKTSRFWLIGVYEYAFVGVIPEKDELEPSIYQRPPIKTLKMKYPFVEEADNEKDQETKKYSDVLRKQMILDHEKFRNQKWMPYKITRGRTDNLYPYSDTILDKTGLLKSEESIEKDLVDLFQDYLVNEEYEKALILASTLKKAKSLSICVILCNQLNGVSLIDKINDLLEARKKADQIEEAQNRAKGGSNEIVIIKGNESNPILENKNKIKKGLSSYAVQLPSRRRDAEEEIDYDKESRNVEPSIDDILNVLGEGEGNQKSIHNKENKQSSINRGLSFGSDNSKKASGEIEVEKKAPVSLFEKFSVKNPNNPLKRKPDQPLAKDDLKKIK